MGSTDAREVRSFHLRTPLTWTTWLKLLAAVHLERLRSHVCPIHRLMFASPDQRRRILAVPCGMHMNIPTPKWSLTLFYRMLDSIIGSVLNNLAANAWWIYGLWRCQRRSEFWIPIPVGIMAFVRSASMQTKQRCNVIDRVTCCLLILELEY